MARVGDNFLTEQDKASLELVPRRDKNVWGERPAVLNVDNYRSVAGEVGFSGSHTPARAGLIRAAG